MATHQPTTVITREVLEHAPMFTMFQGRPPTAAEGSIPKLWAVFNEGQQDFSDAVDVELERRGITVDGHIETDDHLRRVLEEGVEGEHKKPLYDDVDASLLALNAGMKLIKCPDDLESPHWRMYVVHQVDLHQWRAAVEGCTRAEAKNRNFFALYGGCGAGPLPRPGVPVEQVDFDLSKIGVNPEVSMGCNVLGIDWASLEEQALQEAVQEYSVKDAQATLELYDKLKVFKAIVVCANWPHPNGKCHIDMEIETDCLYDINASRVAIQAAIAEYVALGFEIDVTATDNDCKWIEFTVMGISEGTTAGEVQELLENFLALLTSNAVPAEEN